MELYELLDAKGRRHWKTLDLKIYQPKYESPSYVDYIGKVLKELDAEVERENQDGNA